MDVTRWTLRQVRASDLRAPRRRVEHTALTPVLTPSAGLARFLYEVVGEAVGWTSRLGWDEGDWAQHLDRGRTELWLSWQHGRPTGFAELTIGLGEHREITRIDYLGLLPGRGGDGLGARLTWDVVHRCWCAHQRHRALPPVEVVELETTSDDHPAALPNYRRRGFQVVARRTATRAESPANRPS